MTQVLPTLGCCRPPPPNTQAHLSRVGEERCAFCRVMVFANKAMQSRAALEREAANWIEEAGTLPPGGWAGGRAAGWVGGWVGRRAWAQAQGLFAGLARS